MIGASCVILGCAAAAMLLSMLYFRRITLSRPPLGVINLWDVALLLAAIVLVPYLYLGLPPWLVMALLALGMAALLYVTLEPILRHTALILLAALLLAGAGIIAARNWGAGSMPFFLINNALLVLTVIGFSNLWAQGGISAGAVAILAGALTLYDFVFTEQLSLMSDLFHRLAAIPFAPILAWPVAAGGAWLGLGLGDLIVATLVPLVLRKAYGRAAGAAAIAINTLAIALLLLLLAVGMRATFPVMVLLGPLTVLQYFFWQWRRGPERTTWQYLQAEPQRTPGASRRRVAHSP